MAVDPTKLCQIEIAVSDLTRALAFYAGAFGWTRTPAELHEYAVLSVPETCAFGISLVPDSPPPAPGGITLYFAVTEAAAVVASAVTHGGSSRGGPTSVAGYGTVWRLADPDGNVWGVYESVRPR